MPIWNSKLFKSVCDHLPHHRTELLLSYDEYIDTWAELVEETYAEAVRAPLLEKALYGSADGGAAARLSNVVLVSLTVLATQSWETKPRIRAELRERVSEDIAYQALGNVMHDKAAFEELMVHYRAYKKQFREMVDQFTSKEKGDTSREKQDAYARYAIMARYCVAQGLGDEEVFSQDGMSLIQELSIAFVQADNVFIRLIHSSIPDGNTLFLAHPRFIVLQE